MGYYMRFFDATRKPLTLRNIRTALRRYDRQYELAIPTVTNPRHGILWYAGVVYAEVDLSEPGDGVFDDEIVEMLAEVAAIRGRKTDDAKNLVEESLREAKRTVVVCVRFGTKELEETLARIDPLWEWLFDARSGLLQADGEGFYNDDGLIFAVK